MAFSGDWQVKALAAEQRRLVFELIRFIPNTETYSLIDQIKRSSRSVSANIAEAFSKRSYPLHLRSKLTDAVAENAETRIWLETILECRYMAPNDLSKIMDVNGQITRLLNYMIIHKEKFAERKPKP